MDRPVIAALPSNGLLTCERSCALLSQAETCFVDFIVAAVYSLPDWCGASLFCLSG